MDIFTRLMRPTREGHDKSALIRSNGGDLNPNLQQHQASSALTRRIYQQEQLRNPRRRAIFKDGECNVLPAKTTKRQLRFLQDMFTSLVDIQWRFTLLAFMIAYFGSWLFFSLLWWLIAFTHGDLEEEHLPNLQAQNNWNPCILNIYSWTSCFLFGFETQTTIGYGVRVITEECPQAIFIVQMQWMSAMVIDSFMIGVVFAKLTRPKLKRQTILFSKNAVISQRDETQSTIGYGTRTITEECPQAIFIMQIQCMCAMMIDCFMIGVIFAKLTRPKLRTQTILFSKNALINQRNQRYCLMFRIGDISRTRIIGCTIRALLIRFMRTREGEILKSYQHELQIQADDCSDSPFLLWPMIIFHKIDENSPLYNLSAQKLRQEHFEIVVLLEGTVESTGQTIQARSSYLSYEILWGYRFESLITLDKDHQGYEVDYLKFNCIYPVNMPVCSAAEFEAMNPKNDEEIAEKYLLTTPSTPETPQPLIYGNYTNFIDPDYNQSFV